MTGWTFEAVDALRDLSAILALDASTFSSPWTRAMYQEFLSNQEASGIVVLRSDEGELAGYCSFMLIVDELHINNLAVREASRGAGLGAALLREVARRAVRRGAVSATLEVRRSNAAARRLYERAGFVEEGVRRNYYSAPAEDALVLWLRDLPGYCQSDPEF
jgi:ribosomal-protein-alanine N-acetyltransferase